jgi:undecaprenyl diphosphate synthase
MIPRHVAIIMDGNGRWAAARGLPRVFGHRTGAKIVRRTVENCAHAGVEALTLFAFSSENWRRPKDEVEMLMGRFLEALENDVEDLHKNGIRLRFIGERTQLAPELAERMQGATNYTAGNRGMVLNVAIAYGGRWDIEQAARSLAEACVAGRLQPSEISEATLSERLALAGQPEPDLLIRTGGEQRISNFLLWNLAYSELYFCDTLWPDFDQRELDRAFEYYAGRQRRFGLTPAQVEAR